jgi:hypothetical protein
MLNIHILPATVNRTKVGTGLEPWLGRYTEIGPSIDTDEVFIPKPVEYQVVKHYLSRIRKVLNRPIDKVDYTNKFGVKVAVNRVPLEVLPILAEQLHHCFHIAYDFHYQNEADGSDGQEKATQYVVLKHRSPHADKVYYDNVYWDKEGREKAGKGWPSAYASDWSGKNDRFGRKRRYSRQLLVYRKSRTIVRVELRFTNAQAVKRAGFTDVMQLADLNPAEIWERNLMVVSPQEAFVERMVRQGVEDERVRYLRRQTKGETWEQAQERIAERVRSIFKNADMQGLVKGMKHLERVIQKHPVEVPVKLDWDRVGGMLFGQKSSVGKSRG